MTRRLALWMWLALALSAPRASADEAFAVTTTFELVGSTGRMELEPPYTVVSGEYTVHSDAVVRRDGSLVFVVNRLFGDNVLVLDASDGYGVVTQYSVTDAGANPRDIEVVAPGRSYVTLYEDDLVRIGDPVTGDLLGTIDLSAFADADGVAEVDQMARLGERIFVAVQNLDRAGGWIPAGSSKIVVVDTTTDEVIDATPETPSVDAIELQYQNPFWEMRYEPSIQRIVAICSGRFLDLDGALELVNPFTLKSEGALVSELELNGDVLDYVLVDDTMGYVLVERLNFDTCLLRFDPRRVEAPTEVYCSQGFQLQDLELSASGKLYLGDRAAANPGLRVFDAATGASLAGPIGVGLPPFDFVLVEDAIVGTRPPTPPPTARLVVWPNPFNPRVNFELPDWPASREAPALRIFDGRGRQVAMLPSPGPSSPARYFWQGTDADGRQLPSGVYFARPELDGASATKLILLR